MKFVQEIRELFLAILKWLYSFLGVLIFVFIFGLKEISFFDRSFLFPIPTHDSFTVIFLKKIVSDLLPTGVELMVTSPVEAFWAQMSIALFLSFVITAPIFFYSILKFAFPAFTKREKNAVFKVIVPSFFLFLLGCAFSYFFLIPTTTEILYIYYVQVIGATSFFALKEFVPFVISLTLGVGAFFMLPIFMSFLSFLGFVSARFWKNNWKYSLLLFLIVSAIITPDGSGLTMLFLSLPLMFLYAMGYLISKKIEKNR